MPVPVLKDLEILLCKNLIFGHFPVSSIFSKKHSKCLKLTLENGQKSGFYKVKLPKFQREDLPWVPQDFDQKIFRKCYLYILEVNGYVFCQFQGYFYFSNFGK